MSRHDMPLCDPREAFVTAAHIDAAEDFAITVEREAGCPSTTCPGLTLCEPCGGMVCGEHTPAAAECVEVGEHHARCIDGCTDCARERQLERADGAGLTVGGWR